MHIKFSGLFEVSISPKQVMVPPNTPFSLTCFFKDVAVKDYIFWQSKKSSDDNPWMTVGNAKLG